MFKAFVIAICLLFMPISNASAQTLNSGMDFMNQCTIENENEVELLYCIGYISGFLDGYKVSSVMNICTPKKGISPEQVMLVYNKYADENPKVLHNSARIILAASLAEAYPCNK